jgi:hypothetical protein
MPHPAWTVSPLTFAVLAPLCRGSKATIEQLENRDEMDAENKMVGANRPGRARTHLARCCRALAPGVGASFASGDPLLIEAKHAKVHVKSFNGKTVKVNKHVHVNKNVYVKNKNIYVNKKVVVARPYRAWVRRPYYGTYVAGVALGTILAVTGVPVAPAPNLCWYWANPAMTRGYWDYCYY